MYLISIIISEVWASQVALVGKNQPANLAGIRNAGSVPGPGKSPQRRAWQPTPVFLPGESPWAEEPGGLSPQGRKESDLTRVTEHTGAHLWRNRSSYHLRKPLTVCRFESCSLSLLNLRYSSIAELKTMIRRTKLRVFFIFSHATLNPSSNFSALSSKLLQNLPA